MLQISPTSLDRLGYCGPPGRSAALNNLDEFSPKQLQCDLARQRILTQNMVCPQVGTASWRVSKQFSPATLIDNWFDRRSHFTKQNYVMESTYHADYKENCCKTVDEAYRRKAKHHNDNGLPIHLFTHHHGDAYLCNRITAYDEEINRRDRGPGQRFPEERIWKPSYRAWRPEHNDFPMQGHATNWGLMEKLQHRWSQEDEAEDITHPMTYATVYHASYNNTTTPTDYLTTRRYATRMSRSFSNNSTDTINKSMSYARSNQPDIPWATKTAFSVK